MCLGFLVLPQAGILAATLTSRSIIMEREEPSTASSQEIRFTTPTGVTVAGQTIVLNYPYDFSLSTITVGDIDLFYGPTTGLETSATLAAAAGVGIWGVSVSGRVVTFTAPTDGGPISAGNRVVIRIGTNASGGTNRIVNPGSGGEGPVFISINGTFGDVGGFEVPIYPNDSVAISVTFASAATTTPTPGGGGGGGVDGIAPAIFNVRVINITSSSATVVWDTDESANGLVNYGVVLPYASSTNHTNYVTSHSLPLTGLIPDTLYNYRVTSADAIGNSAYTGNLTFRTLPPPAPPVISNIQVINITDTTAVVTWQTNIAASSRVEYGLTSGYGSTAGSGALVTSHSVSLSGLTIGTTYHFRVSSTEATGLSSSSGDRTFTTLSDLTPPSNVFNFIATAGNTVNNLSWTNPPESDFAYVLIRARTDGHPTAPTDGRFVYQGAATGFTDSGLVNGTTYYYTNFAYDASGNRSSGAFAQATPSGALPLPIVLPPAPPVAPPPVVSPPGAATTTPPVVPGVPTTTVPEIPSGVTITPVYYAAGGTIELEEDAAGTIASIPGAPLLVRVPTAGLGRVPSSASIQIGDSRYALTALPGGEAWGASFIPSDRVGKVPAEVTFFFADGTQAQADTVISLQPLGRVLGRGPLSLVSRPIEGATVTLYELTVGGWKRWDGARYGQSNPIRSGRSGYYGFTVRNGTYRIVAGFDGYVTQERDIRVTRNVASVDILLPAKVEIPVVGPILAFVQSEEVQQAARITAPVLTVVALANIASAASLISIINYLWFLFTQPFLLFRRKRRERWGLVYNSLSKTPIDLVAIRLIHVKTNLILQTRITDAKGRFSFRVRPGQYRIEAVKQGYAFPSEYLKGQSQDGEFVDVYHGEVINVQEETNIALNIPLDPSQKEETPRSIIIKKYLRKFQHLLGLSSVLIMAVALVISPSWWMAGLFGAQILVYLLFRRLALPKKPKGWGIIYEAKTRKPIGTTVVRIFDKKFNKLLETQVTDGHGNYGFFAQKNVYFITAEKKGYKKYRSEDVDLTQKDVTVVDHHIGLDQE